MPYSKDDFILEDEFQFVLLVRCIKMWCGTELSVKIFLCVLDNTNSFC